LSNPVSSLKLHPSTTRGDEGSAKDTRRCFKGPGSELVVVVEGGGAGVLNENVDAVDDRALPLLFPSPLAPVVVVAVGVGSAAAAAVLIFVGAPFAR
jgi:hypothetical protein